MSSINANFLVLYSNEHIVSILAKDFAGGQCFPAGKGFRYGSNK